MHMFSRIKSALRSLLRTSKLDADLDEELTSFLRMLTEEKIRGGMSPRQALREAKMELGGIEQVKEKVRERRIGFTLDTVFQDIRFGVRTMRRGYGFAVVAVLILAIGIGGPTALFSTIHAALLTGIPYPDSDRLVVGLRTVDGNLSGSVSAVDYYDYQEFNRSFEGLAAVADITLQSTSLGGDRPELIKEAYSTWNLLSVLQINPVAGRLFQPEDVAEGRAPLAIISHGFWQRRFGGAADAVGNTIDLDGSPLTVVGVLPRSFHFLHDADVWLLIDRNGPFDASRSSHSHRVIGRLRAGVSLAQAQQEADAIFVGLEEAYPETNAKKGISLSGLQDYLVQDFRLSLLLLLATTTLVLIIACANVAGLLLARGDRRRSELAMRSTLGASRGRLVRQLLTESMILAILAGILGTALAYLLQGALLRFIPLGDLAIDPPGINPVVLSFSTLVALVTGLLVGTLPAMSVSYLAPASRIGSGKRTSPGIRSRRFRGSLVVVQAAVSMVLLIGSGLLLRSIAQLSRVELGFDPVGLFTAQITIPSKEYNREARRQFFASLQDEIESLPGVEASGLSTKLPMVSTGRRGSTWPADEAKPPPQETFAPMVRWVSSGYFEAMGIELLRGRDISPDDVPGRTPEVVLSQETVRAIFGDRDALGRLVHVSGEESTYEVVGVVSDARLNLLRGEPDAAAYMSAAQSGQFRLQLAVRTSADPMGLAEPIEAIVRRADPTVLLTDPASMEAILDEHLSGFHVVIVSLTIFAGVALLLTAVGIYGVLAYQVNQRRREIGIRLALGATKAEVLGSTLKGGAGLVAWGLLVGMVAAYPGTRLIRSLLFQTAPLDPPTYLAAVGCLVLVGALACILPALRATRLDVVEVLKGE